MRARSVSGRALPALCCCMPTVPMEVTQGSIVIRARCWVDFNDSDWTEVGKNIKIIRKDWWTPGGRTETSGIRTENWCTVESNLSVSQRGEFKVSLMTAGWFIHIIKPQPHTAARSWPSAGSLLVALFFWKPPPWPDYVSALFEQPGTHYKSLIILKHTTVIATLAKWADLWFLSTF